ncbi:MAG: PQQ-like beta-propeller repeat protein [Phycisphaerales bacterium]|nr:MAG: PQQ-like beta-propeller repeat protein [Phycisphaerales bacterium]
MENARKVVLVVCAVTLVAGGALAQDWPQWRGPNRDGKVKGFEAPRQWPAELKQEWETTVGLGCATPALVGEKLYAFTRQGGDEVILCLKASDGKVVWQEKYAAQEVTGAAGRHPGPRSSPAVADGKVVTLGVGGVVSCLDAGTGKVLWRKDPFPKVVPRFFTSMSPIVVDGMAIVHLGGQGNGAIIAYDLTSGDEKWRCDDEGPEYASPVLLTVAGTKQIVTLAEKSIVGVGVADGKLLWQRPFAPARRAYNAATPIVDGSTVIYTGAGRGTFAVKIEKQGDQFLAKELWSNADLAPQFNTPVLEGGKLYGLSNNGNLFCIDAQTGQTAWTDETQRGRGGFGAMVDAGSCILVLPSDSKLIVYKPDATQFAELASYTVSDTPTYASPVLAGNNLYVKDEQTIAKWAID